MLMLKQERFTSQTQLSHNPQLKLKLNLLLFSIQDRILTLQDGKGKSVYFLQDTV